MKNSLLLLHLWLLWYIGNNNYEKWLDIKIITKIKRKIWKNGKNVWYKIIEKIEKKIYMCVCVFFYIYIKNKKYIWNTIKN